MSLLLALSMNHTQTILVPRLLLVAVAVVVVVVGVRLFRVCRLCLTNTLEQAWARHPVPP